MSDETAGCDAATAKARWDGRRSTAKTLRFGPRAASLAASSAVTRSTSERQRGAVTVLVAVMLTVLMGFCALAIDIAYALVVRNELQNAADAAALAGAAHLRRTSAAPDWSAAAQAAEAVLGQNRSGAVTLDGADIQPGFWNLAGAQTELLPVSSTPGAEDAAALQVTMRRDTGQNGGRLQLFFANFLGIASVPVSASAIAAVTAPAWIGSGVVFPLAVSTCLYQAYWNSAAAAPGPKNDPATGQPYVIRIGPDYTYAGTCAPGTWSSFENDANASATLRALAVDRNANSLAVGAMIWTQPPGDDALFNLVDGCSARGDRSCETVIVPVVAYTGGHAQLAITGFACLRIELASPGADRYVQATMRANCVAAAASGVGANYGAIATPRLAR